MDATMAEKRKVFCNVCSHETNHAVLHAVSQHWHEGGEDYGYGYEEHCSYLMLQCLGCESVKLREDWNASHHRDVVTNYYPPPTFRKEPKWMMAWWMSSGRADPPPAMLICKEIYKALQNDQPHLAAMGVRAVLEQVMIDKIGGDKNSFAKNLAALCDDGHVSRLQKERLQTVLDAGSATIHRGHTPSKEDLVTLVDIMEHVIESLYIHDDQVRQTSARVPPRSAR
ncbi:MULTISPECIES: DUF4145 domain-containing protein [unclassified Cupriavidus]|uniref:DUF4145 domain-containing protein n=1 Tax=unclassified Cupriavidus TaxID=2640874 RepID=UPI000B8146A8|nr:MULTISPECIES: DUF4145 domain-containing protein [unclassified Cupriavidus]